jgi:hypothetical protein
VVLDKDRHQVVLHVDGRRLSGERRRYEEDDRRFLVTTKQIATAAMYSPVVLATIYRYEYRRHRLHNCVIYYFVKDDNCFDRIQSSSGHPNA